MTHTTLKAHLALLKDVASDALNTLDEDEARTNFDVSHIAEQREATFRFTFPGKVVITELCRLLAAISQKHNVDPGYVMVSTQDYSALLAETAEDAAVHRYGLNILCLSNDHTGGSCRVIVSPEVEEHEVVFGALYLSVGVSAVDADVSSDSGQTLATMSS